MRDDDNAALFVAAVRPLRQSRFQRSPQLPFLGTVGAPRHDQASEAEQCQVAENMLSVFLRCIHDGLTIAGDDWFANEVLFVREELAPL